MSDQFNDGFDHEFLAIHDSEIEWEEDLANELLTLPKGVKAKVFAHDKKMGRIDMKVKFPPGYVEPAHSHKSWHSILVLKALPEKSTGEVPIGTPKPIAFLFTWPRSPPR